ncbi:MAG: cobyrinate a,c-diamide synthase [Geminicoccaceae bacterium]
MAAPGLIIAATASGRGKTLITLGLIEALQKRSLRVASFKAGPDYIDPGFHRLATGRPCLNLDSWAMRLETLAALADACQTGADLVVGEGVMGLFDGAPDGSGSTADLAALLDLPVLLVIDCKGMGASAAAVAEGFIRYREDVEVVGIILNRCAGERHAQTIIRACDDRFSTVVLGWLPENPELRLPSRHLGLVQATEQEDLPTVIQKAADLVASRLDFDRLLKLKRHFGLNLHGPRARPLPALGQRIAIAQDVAFAFLYPAIVEGWRNAGAELSFFSPLSDQGPAKDADAVFLPGGYPELHAGKLSNNQGWLGGLKAARDRGAAIYGECGGFMVLGRHLVDGDGTAHPMAGLLPIDTSFAQRRLHLGYRQMSLTGPSLLGSKGARFRGHEFHYASRTDDFSAPPLFQVRDADGRELGDTGAVVGRVAGSFLHLIDAAPHLAIVR